VSGATAAAQATALVPVAPDTVVGRRRYLGLFGPRGVRVVSGGPAVRRRILVADAALPVNLALQGVTGARLDSTAAVTVNATLDSLPLDLASRFTDAVSNVAGTLLGDVRVRGTVRRPEVAGDLRVAGGRAKLTAVGATFRDIAAAVRLRGDTIVVDSLAARAGQGTVRLAGGFGIAKPAEPSFDLRLVARNARVLDGEQGRINADAQVSVYGPFNNVFVSGGARVRGGVVYIPESDSRQVLSADDPAVFAVVDTARLQNTDVLPSQSPLLANLRVDVSAAVERDTWVRSREANVEIYSDGDLRLRVDRARQALVLDGIVVTDRGEYTFLGKRFQIKRGAVTFVNTQELDPDLQLTAEYEVAQARCRSSAAPRSPARRATGATWAPRPTWPPSAWPARRSASSWTTPSPGSAARSAPT
jgi:translocation and assembly module TamB